MTLRIGPDGGNYSKDPNPTYQLQTPVGPERKLTRTPRRGRVDWGIFGAEARKVTSALRRRRR